MNDKGSPTKDEGMWIEEGTRNCFERVPSERDRRFNSRFTEIIKSGSRESVRKSSIELFSKTIEEEIFARTEIGDRSTDGFDVASLVDCIEGGEVGHEVGFDEGREVVGGVEYTAIDTAVGDVECFEVGCVEGSGVGKEACDVNSSVGDKVACAVVCDVGRDDGFDVGCNVVRE